MKQVLLSLGLFCILTCTIAEAQVTYYVKSDGNDTSNGLSWGTAYATVQKAIESAVSGDEIWVAAGTYIPSAYPRGTSGLTDQRDFTFHLRDGVAMYGGFAGTESDLSERIIADNPTVFREFKCSGRPEPGTGLAKAVLSSSCI